MCSTSSPQRQGPVPLSVAQAMAVSDLTASDPPLLVPPPPSSSTSSPSACPLEGSAFDEVQLYLAELSAGGWMRLRTHAPAAGAGSGNAPPLLRGEVLLSCEVLGDEGTPPPAVSTVAPYVTLYHGCSEVALKKRWFPPPHSGRTTTDDHHPQTATTTTTAVDTSSELTYLAITSAAASCYSPRIPLGTTPAVWPPPPTGWTCSLESTYTVLQCKVQLGNTMLLDDAPITLGEVTPSSVEEGGGGREGQDGTSTLLLPQAAVYWLDGSACYAVPRCWWKGQEEEEEEDGGGGGRSRRRPRCYVAARLQFGAVTLRPTPTCE